MSCYNTQYQILHKMSSCNQLSKQQLISRLTSAENEKKELLEQFGLIQNQIKGILQKYQKNERQVEAALNPILDEHFSKDYYRIEKIGKGQRATWLKPSTNPLYDDYQYWPTVRTSEIITESKVFQVTLPGYGWIGLGTKNMRNDGFPGYTPEGWMLCTDGRVYHNRAHTATNNLIKFANRKFKVTVDAVNSTIAVDGIEQKMGPNLPKQVYFVVSIYGARAPYVEIEQ